MHMPCMLWLAVVSPCVSCGLLYMLCMHTVYAYHHAYTAGGSAACSQHASTPPPANIQQQVDILCHGVPPCCSTSAYHADVCACTGSTAAGCCCSMDYAMLNSYSCSTLYSYMASGSTQCCSSCSRYRWPRCTAIATLLVTTWPPAYRCPSTR